jgi:hypothetical protein
MYGTYTYGSTEYGGIRKAQGAEVLVPRRIYENSPDKFKWKRGMFMAKADKFKKKLTN